MVKIAALRNLWCLHMCRHFTNKTLWKLGSKEWPGGGDCWLGVVDKEEENRWSYKLRRKQMGEWLGRHWRGMGAIRQVRRGGSRGQQGMRFLLPYEYPWSISCTVQFVKLQQHCGRFKDLSVLRSLGLQYLPFQSSEHLTTTSTTLNRCINDAIYKAVLSNYLRSPKQVDVCPRLQHWAWGEKTVNCLRLSTACGWDGKRRLPKSRLITLETLHSTSFL